MVLLQIKIRSWLQKPKVWRFVCFVSSIVGLLCYGFSSSFNHLFGRWTLWKILLYIIFSFIICLTVLFAKAWECSTYPRLKAHVAFLILMITSVYSFFFDREVKGKPDAYSLVSSAAFAIMSLALTRLSHLGFEVDLLYFFCGVLTMQLMKIKLWLVIVGGSFSYCLIILRSSLDALARRGYEGLEGQDHADVEFGSHSQSQGTRASLNTSQAHSPQAIIIMAQEADSPPENDYEDIGFLVGSPSQQGDSVSNNSIMEQFMGCIEALKNENSNVVVLIFKYVDKYLEAKAIKKQIQVVQLHRDDNLVVDSLPSGIINDLRESTRQMVTAGLEDKCLDIYSTCRREFLREILSTFVSKKLYLIKALNMVDMILLPNEIRLGERIFEGIIHGEDNYLALLRIILQKNPVLPGIDAVRLWKNLSIDPALIRINLPRFEDVLHHSYSSMQQVTVPDSRIHRTILVLLDYIQMLHQNWERLFDPFVDKMGKFSLRWRVTEIAYLIDSSLEAISKNYNDRTLGYLFIINNRRFIEQSIKMHEFGPIFYFDWLQQNTAKLEQNLELYLGSSWSKILDILKLDINELEPNIAAEIMKKKLQSFNEHFDDICNAQATWFVLNEELRKQIIKSTESILLPAYGNFIGSLQDFLGNQAYKYIKHGIFDVKDRLNNLFLVRE